MRKRLIIPLSIVRNLSVLLLVVGVVLLTPILRRGNSQDASKTAPEVVNRYKDIEKVSELISTYQKNANDLFNLYIDDLNKKFITLKEDERVKFISPPAPEKDKDGNPTGRRLPCTGDNRSTYCLSLSAVDDYFLFREQMIKIRADEKNNAQKLFDSQGQVPYEQRSIGGTLKDIATSQKTVQAYGAELGMIDRELDVSRQAIDQSLAAYNELQMALPLHYKYLEVIKALEIYRDQVAAVRKVIEQFPPAFLNVTTTACT